MIRIFGEISVHRATALVGQGAEAKFVSNEGTIGVDHPISCFSLCLPK